MLILRCLIVTLIYGNLFLVRVTETCSTSLTHVVWHTCMHSCVSRGYGKTKCPIYPVRNWVLQIPEFQHPNEEAMFCHAIQEPAWTGTAPRRDEDRFLWGPSYVPWWVWEKGYYSINWKYFGSCLFQLILQVTYLQNWSTWACWKMCICENSPSYISCE